MRIQSSVLRSALLCSLALGALAAGAHPAVAEVMLIEKDGWTFYTDGRVNAFLTQTWGDDFPAPTVNPSTTDPTTGATVMQPQHTVTGSGQPFTAGFPSDQGDPTGKVFGGRVRSGFLGSILAFGIKRQVTATTSAKAYIALWGTAESYGRDRTQDFGKSTSKGLDVREGWIYFDGPWGGFTAGRQGGILGGMSTEIDFLYAHGYGLGLPCLDVYYPACGHIGTGALGPGNAAGFVYGSPKVGGLKLTAGLYDPVRLLGAWERTPYPRPEGALTFDRRFTPGFFMKLAVEGMFQKYYQRAGTDSTNVWGVAGGGRFEIGFFRLGLSAFRGKGLGSYVALQNSMSTFSGVDLAFRYFTGLYAQTAFVFGREQLSFGGGQVHVDQLPEDKLDGLTSQLKNQTGYSVVFQHTLTENVVLDIDYFMFRTDWWGAPNSQYGTDAMGNQVVQILPGYLTPEKQVINFLNVGATFRW